MVFHEHHGALAMKRIGCGGVCMTWMTISILVGHGFIWFRDVVNYWVSLSMNEHSHHGWHLFSFFDHAWVWSTKVEHCDNILQLLKSLHNDWWWSIIGDSREHVWSLLSIFNYRWLWLTMFNMVEHGWPCRSLGHVWSCLIMLAKLTMVGNYLTKFIMADHVVYGWKWMEYFEFRLMWSIICMKKNILVKIT